MAGAKTNVVTYSFEGETLSLEQAIKRIKTLLDSTSRSLKKSQNGELTETQKAARRQTKALLKVLEEKAERESFLNDREKKEARVAGRQALSNVRRLQSESLKLKDKARAKELREEQRAETQRNKQALAEALKQEKLLEFARTTAGQEQAMMQAASLTRLAAYTADPAARAEIEGVVAAYNQAVDSFKSGIGTQTELAEKTVELNNAYKNYAATLRSVKTLQNQDAKGASLLGYVFSKFKSLAVYKMIKAFLAKIAQEVKKSLDTIAHVSEPFNRSMSQFISEFKYLINSLATIAAPIIQLITPMLKSLADLVNLVSERFAKLFAAVAGNDAWLKANYQLEDYLDTLDKAKSNEGIDELNRLNTEQETNTSLFTEVAFEDSDAALKSLSGLSDILNNILGTLGNLFNALSPVLDLLVAVSAVVLSLVVALQPVLNLVTAVIGVLATALGGTLTALVNYILVPVFNWLGYIINHLELLIPLVASLLALFAAASWTKFVGTLKLVGLGFVNIAKAIWGAITAAVKWIATQIKTIATNIKNAVSAWIAEKAYWKLAIAAIAASGVMAIAVLATIGTAVAGGSSLAATNEGVNPEAYMARGGVVTRPTIAMVGEGKYDEAVIPLGQSPQFESMKEGIAEAVISSIGRSEKSGSNGQPIVLNIDGRTLARALWPSLEKTYNQVGVKLK